MKDDKWVWTPTEEMWARLARLQGWDGNPETLGDWVENWQYMGTSCCPAVELRNGPTSGFSPGWHSFRRRAGILGPNNPPHNEWVKLPVVGEPDNSIGVSTYWKGRRTK